MDEYGSLSIPLDSAGLSWHDEGVTEDDRVRLGQFIAGRRNELGLSVAAASAKAQVDRATWASAEGGLRTIAPRKRRAFEDTLRWAPGSIDTIMSGGDPRLVAPPKQSIVRPSDDPDIREEIERISGMRVSLASKRAMLRALIDFYSEPEPQPEPAVTERATG